MQQECCNDSDRVGTGVITENPVAITHCPTNIPQ